MHDATRALRVTAVNRAPVADVYDARAEHPAVQGELAAELVADPTEDGEGLAAVGGVDRGDATQLTDGVAADPGVAGDEGVARQPRRGGARPRTRENGRNHRRRKGAGIGLVSQN
mgnify:CR=1 FL=1